MKEKNEVLFVIGKIISRILGPFSSAPLVFFLLVFLVTEDSISKFSAWGILAFAFYIVPGFAYIRLRSMGKISDLELTKRAERHPLLELMLVSYWIAVYLLTEMFGFGAVLTQGVFVYVLSFTVLTIITVWYKISLHMAMWVILGLFMGTTFGNLYYLVLACIMLTIAWARFYLKKHTLAQLFWGAIVPTLVFFIVRIIVN